MVSKGGNTGVLPSLWAEIQSSVVTYLKCGEVFNNQIQKGLLLSLFLKFFLNR